MSLNSLFDAAGTGNRPSGRMRAVEITQAHDIRIVETRSTSRRTHRRSDQATACGICGTDLHILKHGFPGTVYPVTPGHEFAGNVVAIGVDVRGIREGDFVAVDPNVVCGQCRWCRAGRPNLCLHLSPIGVRRAGAAADYVALVAPARNAFHSRCKARRTGGRSHRASGMRGPCGGIPRKA